MKRPLIILGVVLVTILSYGQSFGKNAIKSPVDCQKLKADTCPASVCEFGCVGNIGYGCTGGCMDRPCLDISDVNCPQDRCQVLIGCDGKKVCFGKFTELSPKCGEIGYEGQDVACCDGLVKRCGVEYFDRTCDMLGKKSIYGIPICIPCGNGICNQFENTCNCPEDCLK